MAEDEQAEDDGLDDHDRARASDMDERPIYGTDEEDEQEPEIQEVAA
jgi:hypothetical protein